MKPTKLLKETAVRWARKNKMDCKIVMENTVALPQVTMDDPGGEVEVDLFVLDRNPGLPLLAIMAYELVRFPDDEIDRALDMCDRLNRAGMGKFTTMKEYEDADPMIVYCIECPIAEGSHAKVFAQTIEVGIKWLKSVYPVLLLVRWGDMSVERAFNIWRGKEEAPQDVEEEDGSIMTDEDIRRLMGED